MKDKIIAYSLILTLLVSAIVLMAPVKNVSVLSEPDPKTWIVDDDGPADFTKIQDAINAASHGDTIFVHNGTYYENLVVNKRILLIGENKRGTIIDGNGIKTVVKVTSGNVIIANFTMQNSGGAFEDSGIHLSSNDSITINNNIILDCYFGIWLYDSDGNILTGNIILNSTFAIRLRDSSNSAFKGNIVRNNTWGIYLRFSSGNSIYNNIFDDNIQHVYVEGSANFWNSSYPFGGNYWSNYTGVDLCHGPNQNLPGSDGIGDTPHNVTANGAEKDGYSRLPTVRNIETGPNVDTGLDYFRIQDAIDADETRNGHTIKVNASIYYEHVSVYKLLTLLPEDSQTTAIIDGTYDGKEVLHVSASNVSISNFTIQNGEYGIHLDGSGSAILRNNNMTHNKYNFFVTGTTLSHFINDVDDSNLMDGKQVCYLVNNQNIVVNSTTHPNLGYLTLVNCTNITVQNLNLTGNGQGLLLAFTNRSTIMNVYASSNLYGIYVHDSFGDNITGNSITENWYGVYLVRSSGNNVVGNNVTGRGLLENMQGIVLLYSNNSKVAENIVTNNYYSINVTHCSENNVSNNTIIGSRYGIALNRSSYNSLKGNYVTNNGLAGIFLLYSSSNNISGNNVTTADQGAGIDLWYSDVNTIANNSVTGKGYGKGIHLYSSSQNSVIENIMENNTYQLFLQQSSGNTIIHNCFINKTKYQKNTYTDGKQNTWCGNSTIGGNYWSNYTTPDWKRGESFADQQIQDGSDGIVDYSYSIDSNNKDKYPLTKKYCGEHDLGIKIINILKSSNASYNINLTVINYGFQRENGINITIRACNATQNITLYSTIFYLESRNSTPFIVIWNITGLAKGKYVIETNLTHVLGEKDFNDNTDPMPFAILLIGDINNDGKVDIKDLVLVIKYFATYPGHPDWNPNADVNWDGKVDIKDLVLVIKHFKESIPDP